MENKENKANWIIVYLPYIYRSFGPILEVHAPLKRRKVSSNHTPWISPLINNLMRERDQAKKRAEKDHNVWPRYKKLRNKVTSELRNCVQDYYHNMIEEKLW